MRVPAWFAVAVFLASPGASAAPVLADSSLGSLTPVIQASSALPRIDGLTFDSSGRLFAALETLDSRSGVVFLDKTSGAVEWWRFVPGADQVEFGPSGDLFVTSELPATISGFPAGGVYRVPVSADASGMPSAGTPVRIATTPTEAGNPEGLVVLKSAGAYGSAGDFLLAEDAFGGRILRLAVTGDAAGTLSEIASASASLARPEGLAFGDFAGAAAPALYAAETAAHRVLRVAADGTLSTLGDPQSFGLQWPDNLEFGPDGFLYVTEDLISGGRIVRIAADGTHSVFATGFAKPAGIAFDPVTGDLYIAEQEAASLWRVRFASPVPEPGTWASLAAGLALLWPVVRSRRPAVP